MKKLIFGLIATVMVSVSSFGQKLTEVQSKNIVNAQMVTLVNTAKGLYVKGQTYNDFVKALTIPSPTVPSQEELLRKVYGYVSLGTADCDIMKTDNTILGKYAIDLANSPRNLSTPNATFSEQKKWWQILLNAIVNGVLDTVLPLNNENVDMFPDQPGGTSTK